MKQSHGLQPLLDQRVYCVGHKLTQCQVARSPSLNQDMDNACQGFGLVCSARKEVNNVILASNESTRPHFDSRMAFMATGRIKGGNM